MVPSIEGREDWQSDPQGLQKKKVSADILILIILNTKIIPLKSFTKRTN